MFTLASRLTIQSGSCRPPNFNKRFVPVMFMLDGVLPLLLMVLFARKYSTLYPR